MALLTDLVLLLVCTHGVVGQRFNSQRVNSQPDQFSPNDFSNNFQDYDDNSFNSNPVQSSGSDNFNRWDNSPQQRNPRSFNNNNRFQNQNQFSDSQNNFGPRSSQSWGPQNQRQRNFQQPQQQFQNFQDQQQFQDSRNNNNNWKDSSNNNNNFKENNNNNNNNWKENNNNNNWESSDSSWQSNSGQQQDNSNSNGAPVHYVDINPSLDGNYKFGYHTGGKGADAGSFREETRLPDGTVKGAYGYVDANGKQRIVRYTAGKDGYKVEGDTSPDEAPTTPKPQPAQQQQSWQSPQPQQQLQSGGAMGSDGQPFHEMTRLPDGTVKGTYGYTDANGKMRIVRYTAGKDGYKPEGDISADEAPAAPQPQPQPQQRQPQPSWQSQQSQQPSWQSRQQRQSSHNQQQRQFQSGGGNFNQNSNLNPEGGPALASFMAAFSGGRFK